MLLIGNLETPLPFEVPHSSLVGSSGGAGTRPHSPGQSTKPSAPQSTLCSQGLRNAPAFNASTRQHRITCATSLRDSRPAFSSPTSQSEIPLARHRYAIADGRIKLISRLWCGIGLFDLPAGAFQRLCFRLESIMHSSRELRVTAPPIN